MNDESAPSPIWPRYGLRGNPFFHQPLVSVNGADYGIHLFRGERRRRDARELVQAILNSDNSIHLIEGRNGIGKTTLANQAKFQLDQRDDCAVHPDVLQIDLHAPRPLEQLAADLLHAAVSALAYHGETRAVDAAVDQAQGLILDQIIRLKGGTISVNAIVGGSLSRNDLRIEARTRPFGDWHAALRTIAASARAEGIRHIVLHINNLDQSTLTDAPAVGDLFGNARDLLQTVGFHFILCANEAFRTRSLKDRRNVKDIIGAPQRPQPLDASDFSQLVSARYDHLHDSQLGPLVPPIEPAEAAKVYAEFGGEIRAALECIERSFAVGAGTRGLATTLTAATVLEDQRAIFLDLLDTLSEPALSLLIATKQALADSAEIRQKELVAFLQASDDAKRWKQGYVSQVADELVSEYWLVKRQPHAKAAFYSLGGRARILGDDLAA